MPITFFDSLDALQPTLRVRTAVIADGWSNRAIECSPGRAGNAADVDGAIRAHQRSQGKYGVDRWRSAANMYLIETNKTSCFFAGDTALTPDTTHLVENHLAAKGRVLDLALLPIGYAPWWKPGFRKGHLTSQDALTLFERLEARYFIPYHWGTFNHVTSTAFDAIDRLRVMLQNHPLHPGVKILEPGTTFVLPTTES